ncbi:hypothetical protein BFS06_13900 [Clostridium perfringens]|uniref:leucine-rich repeat domain-containing protein n=1 Tax=Clostridium perfringens TaxID=1502 RepID=UPI0010DDA588|nr:leucine-rich repeat domain-containing protein [Clostridium perfringens]TBX14299.1 hypothetical protein BFS06_13900 [Clostridium perfringens]
MKRLEIKLTLDVEKVEDINLEVLNLLNNNGYSCVKSKILNEEDVATTPDEFEYVIIDESFINEKLNVLSICSFLEDKFKKEKEDRNIDIDISFKDELINMSKELVGTACITKYLSNKNIVKIPNTINNIPVTTIGNMAFSGVDLKDIELPDTLIYIGSDSFNGANIIDELTIPKNVRFIDSYAFSYNQLNKLILFNNLLYIGNHAFIGNEIKSLIIPDSVKYIGRFAFQDNLLSSIKLSNSMEIISNDTFCCNELKEVIIPNSVKYIEDNAFYFNEIVTVKLGNNVEYIGKDAFSNNSIENLSLSQKLKYIMENAFLNNKIENIQIPASVDTLEFKAFYNNPIMNVIIPGHLIKQKEVAFSDEYSIGKFYNKKIYTKFVVIQ